MEGRNKQRLPITPAPPHVGGSFAIPQSDRSQVPACKINEPPPTRASTVEITIQVDLHAVGNTGPLILQHTKQAPIGDGAVVQDVVRFDQSDPRVIDIEDLFT